MITKTDLKTRITELRCERERVVAQTIGTYDGAIQELEKLLSSLESSLGDKKTEK